MPKIDGVLKTFSFNSKTISQIKFLCDKLMLSQTSLLEFLINEKYLKEKKDARTNNLQKN